MISPLTYYRKIKDEQHVFIYCVAGRSSSTAFQRILNSSNTVWVWGEQHGIIDQAAYLMNLMEKYRNDNDVKNSLIQMYDSYKSDKHLGFYPNAIGNLDTTMDILTSSISNILKPWASSINRFGFKDIGVNDIQTLTYLKEIFPKSLIVFCFRNPLMQWPSVRASGWWAYCNDLETFLNEYFRLSSIYLTYASINDINAFVENTDLKDHIKIKNIINYLNLPRVDLDLIGITISSNKVDVLSDADEEFILNSNAYNNYLKMKSLSSSFNKMVLTHKGLVSY
jgi:hypothetical protein